MNERGKSAEDIAVIFLKKKGYKIVERNFRCYFGEIDVIAKDEDCLAFIEVKYRKSDAFGGAVGAVTSMKQEKIKKTAQLFLQKSGEEPIVRFDVVLITGEPDNLKKAKIEVIKDAFR